MISSSAVLGHRELACIHSAAINAPPPSTTGIIVIITIIIIIKPEVGTLTYVGGKTNIHPARTRLFEACSFRMRIVDVSSREVNHRCGYKS